MRAKVLIINGSLGGKSGNTARLIERLCHELSPHVDLSQVDLIENKQLDQPDHEAVVKLIHEAQGFVFATGTYWDSWGSPLQAFLERATPLEATDAWLGKPAAALVTMHSVGGKEVLSRLQGVLATLGLLIPPMCGLAYSLANQLALESASSGRDDLFCLDDLGIVAQNLRQALAAPRMDWATWPVDRSDATRVWLPSSIVSPAK